MAFSSLEEVQLAFAMGKVDTHARIKVRLPKDRRLKTDGDRESKPGAVIETTVGRVFFNIMLPRGMMFYNLAMRSSELARVISDCYQALGRRKTIDLLDDMNAFGFSQSTRSGLSFATDDLITPPNKQKIVGEAEKNVQRINKLYQRGIITEGERYNQVLDAWTHARERITAEMMSELETDERKPGYVNPIYLMAHSGARGGVEQIRQLAGMRGLMAKPSGKIIETPIKANFREGLSVLEYFSSTHGARKGLADTALKTADSGYLTRKLADVAQNVVVTTEDCGTTQGITKGVIYRGEKVEIRLADSIRGRVSRANIVNPITDEVIVRENELITDDIAHKIEDLGLEKIQVRSPMTCEASLGVCRCCYGMDLSTGSMVEEGMAVGIIAAQSIGEPGTQLTMRTFHIGGTAARAVEESDIRAKKEGIVKFARLKVVRNEEGQQVVLTRNGEIVILDPKGRELEQYEVPAGAQLLVEENQTVKTGTVLCQWDPHSIPILAEVGGKVRYEDIIEGETARIEKDAVGTVRRVIQEHKGDMHPQIILESDEGQILDFYYLPEKAHIEVNEGDKVSAGTILAKTPREVSGTQDITGGLPRVTEIFEARKPKDPAVIAEIDGKVEILGEKKRGKRTIIVRSESGIEREHLVSHGKHLRVRTGDYVRAGEALVDGPLVPHDILRISGEEAVQQYLDAGNPERLSQPARRYRRQAHRDHRRPDAAQGDDQHARRHQPAAGQRDGQVRVPHGEPELDQVRQDHGEGGQRLRARLDRPQGGAGGDQRPDRGAWRRGHQGDAAQAGHRQHAAFGHHQGVGAKQQLHLGRQLPGNDQGAHRGRPVGQGRQAGRPEGERDPGPPRSGRHRLRHVPAVRSPHPARGARSPGRRKGTRPHPSVPAFGAWRRRRRRQNRSGRKTGRHRHPRTRPQQPGRAIGPRRRTRNSKLLCGRRIPSPIAYSLAIGRRTDSPPTFAFYLATRSRYTRFGLPLASTGAFQRGRVAVDFIVERLSAYGIDRQRHFGDLFQSLGQSAVVFRGVDSHGFDAPQQVDAAAASAPPLRTRD